MPGRGRWGDGRFSELQSSMAESRLRAPDLGTQLGVSSCLEKCRKSSPDTGKHPFSGKSFYLDLPTGKSLQFLTRAIQQLGGVIEGFLSKEVSYIVSSRREAKAESSGTSPRGCPSPSEVRGQTLSMAHPKGGHTRPSQKPADSGTCPAESRTRKVARLKAPFLKIEDESRKFRPFHHQFKSFPEVSFLGPKDASPFEAAMTLGSSHHTREPKDREPSLRSAARTLPRRRKGFCECCQEDFEELHAHLQSTRHRGFALEAHPYAEVDRVIAQLGHSFADAPSRAGLPRQPGSPSSDGDPLWPETLPPGQPSRPRAACPGMRQEDELPVPGAPERAGSEGSVKPPAEPMGAGHVPGPVASCRELGDSTDVIADPSGTPGSKSPVHQCLPTRSGSAEFSGLDVAPVGHKRKVQLPGGNPEKRSGVSQPQASSFVPRASSPCGTRTTSGRPLLCLPLPGCEHRPLASLLPVPEPLPWQPTERPAEPPWPGGGWPPGI
ncbi:protein DBF4 homolog B isoform X5 [Mirounga angustirostris]|uniref:protein DBF4 homolog B isoform X5 n=1 Tax=Mirounga angustirostris TaxID=9716 RepID=UPI00313BAAB4